jgi:hypothetical protein
MNLRRKRVEEDEVRDEVHARLSEQEEKTIRLESRVKRIELELSIVGRLPQQRESHA